MTDCEFCGIIFSSLITPDGKVLYRHYAPFPGGMFDNSCHIIQRFPDESSQVWFLEMFGHSEMPIINNCPWCGREFPTGPWEKEPWEIWEPGTEESE